MVLWGEFSFWAGLPIAIGIFCYGFTYFVVHDIFIHRRFKIFRNIEIGTDPEATFYTGGNQSHRRFTKQSGF